MHRFPGATVTRYPKLGGFKEQELILSWLSRLQARSQGVGRVALFPMALRDNASSPLLLEVASDPRVPGLVATSRHSPPPSPRGLFFSVCLFLSSFLVNTAVMLHQGPTPFQRDLIFTNYIVNDPLSKQGHILKHGGHDFQHIVLGGGDAIRPITTRDLGQKHSISHSLPAFC